MVAAASEKGKIAKFKNILVQKYWPDLKINLHKCSLGDPLPRLFKLFRSVEKNMAASLRSLFSLYVHCKHFKNLLVQKYLPDLKIIWHNSFFGDPLPRLLKLFRSIEKHGRHNIVKT